MFLFNKTNYIILKFNTQPTILPLFFFSNLLVSVSVKSLYMRHDVLCKYHLWTEYFYHSSFRIKLLHGFTFMKCVCLLYLTLIFNAAFRFLGHENKDTFFKTTQRHQIVSFESLFLKIKGALRILLSCFSYSNWFASFL